MDAAKPRSEEREGRRSGRPTKERAGQLTEHIIEVATALFMESGFAATSIDLIAATARVSKQTFYARFPSKEALFAAVIRKRVDDLLLPVVVDSKRAGPIEAILIRIGVELSKRALSPVAIAFTRLILAEAHQFPLHMFVHKENTDRVRGLVAGIFANAIRDGQLRPADDDFLAEQFIYGVVDGPARDVVLSGRTPEPDEALRERVARAVALFLDGCRGPAPRA